MFMGKEGYISAAKQVMQMVNCSNKRKSLSFAMLPCICVYVSAGKQVMQMVNCSNKRKSLSFAMLPCICVYVSVSTYLQPIK